MSKETIAAISTGLIPGGVGIVRVSGPDAVSVCAPLVKIKSVPLEKAEANHLYYGKIWRNSVLLDEALIAVLRAPHSYTAEDTVELQCHGGPLVLQRVLEAVLESGARLAEPGEFTKRAFLNGRLDLSEAEAVMDLIRAENDFARDTAIRQLGGDLSQKIHSLREVILEKTAFLEAALDDPENYSLDGFEEALKPVVGEMLTELDGLIAGADNGRRLAEGIETAIVGRPNVGKSSLLNRLLGKERAIVTPVAGTTRDTIEEVLRLDDVLLKLSDTAGLREGGDEIERIGMERTREKARESELILLLIDGSRPTEEEDHRLIDEYKNSNCLLLLNKSDLGLQTDPEELKERFGLPVFPVSALKGDGVDAVLQEIRKMFHFDEIRQRPLVITSLRHKKQLEEARNSLKFVMEALENGAPEDFLTIDLMDAYRSLGLIVGEAVSDDLVNEIFNKFCMGK